MVVEIILFCLISIFQLAFIHRYFFCSKNKNKICNNKLCDYYGNGSCKRSAE